VVSEKLGAADKLVEAGVDDVKITDQPRIAGSTGPTR
jgi:hypothetical protein